MSSGRVLRLLSALIGLSLLLTQLPALATRPPQSTNIQIAGEGGQALFVKDASQVRITSLYLMAEAQVEDPWVTGKGSLSFEGKTAEGNDVKIMLDYQIVGGEGFRSFCNNVATCDQTVTIPRAYVGKGLALIRVGFSESSLPMTVIVDTSHVPQTLGGMYRVKVFDSNYQPVLDVLVRSLKKKKKGGWLLNLLLFPERVYFVHMTYPPHF